MGDSKIERDSTEVGNRHQGEVGRSRKLTMVSKYQSLETLRSDDKMATRTSKKETKQKTIGLISKTTTFHVHHTLLCISCRFCTTTTSKCLI